MRYGWTKKTPLGEVGFLGEAGNDSNTIPSPPRPTNVGCLETKVQSLDREDMTYY